MSYFIYQSKRVFYKESGSGKPFILLHGDSASSVMFEMLLPLYEKHFRVILLDFLGNGKSDRVDHFPSDLWISQADQVIALIEHLKLKKVYLLGTSGGAWIAVNTALKRADLIEKVIADSFDGRNLQHDFIDNLIREREYAKKDPYARQFYEWCQGTDWQSVVDLNTQALISCAKRKSSLFSKNLNNLTVPILFTGSLEDEMCRKDMQQEYIEMSELVKHGSVYMFPAGRHPAIISNALDFATLVLSFLNS